MNMRKVLIGIILASFVFLVVGCGSKNVKKAQEFMDVKMYDQALELLQKEIMENPNNDEAHFLAGKAYLLKGMDGNAQEAFERAILVKTTYKTEVGKLYAQIAGEILGENEGRAVRLYQDALKYDSTLKAQIAQILFAKASEIVQRDQKSQQPFSYLKYSIEFNEDYRDKVSDFAYETGKQYAEKGFLQEAQQYAQFSITIAPKHIQDVGILLYNIGMKFAEQGLINQFIKAFHEGKIAFPDYQNTDEKFLWWMGEYYFALGNYVEAKKLYSEVAANFATTEFGKKSKGKIDQWDTLFPTTIAKDTHIGWSGAADIDNRYVVRVIDYKPGKTYLLSGTGVICDYGITEGVVLMNNQTVWTWTNDNTKAILCHDVPGENPNSILNDAVREYVRKQETSTFTVDVSHIVKGAGQYTIIWDYRSGCCGIYITGIELKAK